MLASDSARVSRTEAVVAAAPVVAAVEEDVAAADAAAVRPDVLRTI